MPASDVYLVRLRLIFLGRDTYIYAESPPVTISEGTTAGSRAYVMRFCSLRSHFLLLLTRKIFVLHNVGQDPRIFQQAELFRWLVKADLRLGACLSVDMYKSAKTASPVPGDGDGAITDEGGAHELSTKSPPDVAYDEGIAEANAVLNMAGFENVNVSQNSPEPLEPPVPGEISRKFATDVFPERHLLMGVTQR